MFKRGQIEMMGLLIIVVLIVVGALFYVRFGLMRPLEKVESNVESIQARNLMNAIMNIKVCEVTIKEAVVLCDRQEVLCEKDSCDYIEEKVIEIVGSPNQETGNLLNSKYAFIVEGEGENLGIKVGDCEYGINSPSYLFSEAGRGYNAYFKLC